MRNWIEISVGILVVGAFLALLMMALKVSNRDEMQGDSYRLTAYFENIGGLKKQSAVRSAGVLVGRVNAIAYNNERHMAQVELLIDKRFSAFPSDSSASVLTAGLLGEQYVALQLGGEEQNLVEGDVLLATQSALILEQIIGKFLFEKALAQ